MFLQSSSNVHVGTDFASPEFEVVSGSVDFPEGLDEHDEVEQDPGSGHASDVDYLLAPFQSDKPPEQAFREMAELIGQDPTDEAIDFCECIVAALWASDCDHDALSSEIEAFAELLLEADIRKVGDV